LASPEGLADVDPSDDPQASSVIDAIIQQTEADARYCDERHQELSQKITAIQAVTQITDLASLKAPGVGPVLLQVASISEKFFGAMYIMNSEGFYQRAMTSIEDRVPEAQERAFDPGLSAQRIDRNDQDHNLVSRDAAQIGPFPVSYAPQRATLAGSASSQATTSHPDFATAQLRAHVEDYQAIMQQVLSEVQRGDRSALEKLIPELLTRERALSDQLRLSRSPIAAVMGQSQLYPDLVASYTQVLSTSTSFDLQSIALYGMLADNLLNPADVAARGRTLDQAAAVLNMVALAQQSIDSTSSDVAILPALPFVIVASYSLPDSIEIDRDFTLSARIVNTSPATASNVSLRLRGDNAIPAEESVSLGDLDGTAERELTFNLRPARQGAGILTLSVLSGGSLMSTQLVYVTISPGPSPTSQATSAAATREQLPFPSTAVRSPSFLVIGFVLVVTIATLVVAALVLTKGRHSSS
jgi:hypothetical protein